MIRLPSSRLLAVAALAAAAALPAVPTASAQGASCPLVKPAVAKANAKNQRMTHKLEGNTSYVPRERTLTPTVTVGHDGYATGSIVVKAPKGTAPVVGSFVARGTTPCAITITSAAVVLRRNAYVIRFRAPTGDLGHAGRLTITLISA